MKALIIHPDGIHEFKDVGSTLEDLQSIVGGYLEAISANEVQAEPWVAYCNEEGKLLKLPINPTATWFARAIGWASADTLVGSVIFLGSTGEDEADLPLWVRDEFFKFLGE